MSGIMDFDNEEVLDCLARSIETLRAEGYSHQANDLTRARSEIIHLRNLVAAKNKALGSIAIVTDVPQYVRDHAQEGLEKQ